MKLINIVGTRPQFVKAAMISRAIKKHSFLKEILIHTGQHYDSDMSEIFFHDLELSPPQYNLAVGSMSHAEQTATMLTKLEAIFIEESPDVVLVHGDCNTTIAGALAAKKLNLPVAHVEAGLRSYNRAMPEEINRLAVDAISDILFCPTESSYKTLEKEGLKQRSVFTGDVMYDAMLLFQNVADEKSGIIQKLNLNESDYILCTAHRAETTDNPELLAEVFNTLNEIAKEIKVILPLHPRTKSRIENANVPIHNLTITDPVGYIDMIALEKGAKLILTDSGGVQKEAFFNQVPCVTFRTETEWGETVELGWNVVTGIDKKKIMDAVSSFLQNKPAITKSCPYGDGTASDIIVNHLIENIRA